MVLDLMDPDIRDKLRAMLYPGESVTGISPLIVPVVVLNTPGVKIYNASGTCAGAGDNTITTVPAGYRFIVTYIDFYAASGVSVVWKDGATQKWNFGAVGTTMQTKAPIAEEFLTSVVFNLASAVNFTYNMCGYIEKISPG